MSLQPSLFGDAAAQASDRLFFALFPDEAAAAAIVEETRNLRAALGLSGVPVRPDRLHVTLIHVGDYHGLPQGVLDSAMAAAASVAAPGFPLCFDRAESFSGRGGGGAAPFVLRAAADAEELMGFQRVLSVALIRAGVRFRGGGQFTPHVALLYDGLRARARPVAPIRWIAREFRLIHSRLGRTEHHVVGRWPLY